MEVMLGKYVKKRRLGIFEYGTIFHVFDMTGKQQFLIKAYEKKRMSRYQNIAQLFKQLKEYRMKVKGSHLVECIQYQEDQLYLYFVYEYCEEKGDLLQQLSRRIKNQQGPFPLNDAINIMSQVIEGLMQIQRAGYLHLNLTLQSIYIKSSKEKNYIVKLGDFGFPEWIIDTYMDRLGIFLPHQALCREEDWFGQEYDVWVFGVVFHVLLTKKPPSGLNYKAESLYGPRFKNFSYKQSIKNLNKQIQQSWTPELEDFFRKVLDPDPETRITVSQLKKHKLFTSCFENSNNELDQKNSGKKLKLLPHLMQQEQQKGNRFSSPIYFVGRGYLHDVEADVYNQIIKFDFAKVSFLSFAEKEFAANLESLSAEEVLAFRYNLLKYNSIAVREFINNLTPKFYEKQSRYRTEYPSIKWKQFLEFTELQLYLERTALKSSIFKLSSLYDKLKDQLQAVRKYNPVFEYCFESELTSHSSEGEFMESYNIATIGIYKKIGRQPFDREKCLYLSILAALCLEFPTILKATDNELMEVFYQYQPEEEEEDTRINRINLIAVGRWLSTASASTLKAILTRFVSRYLPNLPINN